MCEGFSGFISGALAVLYVTLLIWLLHRTIQVCVSKSLTRSGVWFLHGLTTGFGG